MRYRLLIPLAALCAVLISGCPLVTPSPGSSTTGGSSSTTGGSDSTAGRTDPNTATAGSTVTCQSPLQGDSWQDQVLQLTNQERARNGVGGVVWNAGLASEAANYACELINGHYFAHVNPQSGESLAQRAQQVDYVYWVIGENLAAGQPDPASVVAAWMNSPEHRDNVLNPAFTELGVAVRSGGDYGIYWVQEFGRPQSESPYRAP
jgi:uncharacterized protein YkwD